MELRFYLDKARFSDDVKNGETVDYANNVIDDKPNNDDNDEDRTNQAVKAVIEEAIHEIEEENDDETVKAHETKSVQEKRTYRETRSKNCDLY